MIYFPNRNIPQINGLTIDLYAITLNWQYLKTLQLEGANCGAVVKANGYGLGAKEVAQSLVDVGCQHFFVTNLEEALEIHPLLPSAVQIYVLSGCRAGEEAVFCNKNIIPVLISLPMFQRWLESCRKSKVQPRCGVKINTGMNRLGLDLNEFDELLTQPELLERAGVSLLLSHLACADEPANPLNEIQLARFQERVDKVSQYLPGCIFSLANSAGFFLSEKYHYQVARPGIALYGGNIQAETPALMPVAYLHLEVLQVRNLKSGESVGYGATRRFDSDRQLIVVPAGYADGMPWVLGNNYEAWCNGHRIPSVGRVSMDSMVFDISHLPECDKPKVGDLVELIGEHITVDEIANKAGTIGYEILTTLGSRFPRTYYRENGEDRNADKSSAE